MSREFRKGVDAGLRELCLNLGYKHRSFVYTLKINDNVHHTISLDVRSYHGGVGVMPYVGVYYKDVDQLEHFLSEYDDTTVRSTAKIFLQSLLPPHPEFITWNFYEGEDNTGVYEDLLNSIQNYGIPFQKKMEDAENLFNALYNKECASFRQYVLPALSYLMGRKEVGIKVIDEYIEDRLKPHVLTDKEYQSEVNTCKALKLPTDDIPRVREGHIEPYYFDFAERYKKLCKGEIVWERNKKKR